MIQAGFVVVGGLSIDLWASDEATAATLAVGLGDLHTQVAPNGHVDGQFVVERRESPWIHWRFSHNDEVVAPAVDEADVPSVVLSRLDTLVAQQGVFAAAGLAVARNGAAMAVVGTLDFELTRLAAEAAMGLVSAYRVVVTADHHVVAYPRPLPIRGDAWGPAGRTASAPASSLFGSHLATSKVPLRALAVRQRSEGPLQFGRVSPAEVLDVLCRINLVDHRGIEHFHALAGLARAIPGYRLVGQEAAEDFWRTSDIAWSAA